MCAMGCAGNLVAFIGFQAEKKKTPTTFLFQCLAVADTAFLVLFASCNGTDAIIQCSSESTSLEYRCDSQAYLFFICDPFLYTAHLTSTWYTVCLAMIPFSAVNYPIKFKTTFTLTRVKWLCLVIAVFSLGFEMLCLVVMDVRELDEVYISTNKSDMFVQFNNNSDELIIYSTETGLSELATDLSEFATDTCVGLMARDQIVELMYLIFILLIDYIIPFFRSLFLHTQNAPPTSNPARETHGINPEPPTNPKNHENPVRNCPDFRYLRLLQFHYQADRNYFIQWTHGFDYVVRLQNSSRFQLEH